MTSNGQARNEVSGGIFFSAVIQGRDITVNLPPQVHPALAGLPDESAVFTGRETDLKLLMGLLDPADTETTAVRVAAVSGLGGSARPSWYCMPPTQRGATAGFPVVFCLSICSATTRSEE